MITIKDRINTLTPDQTQALKDKANAYPFDIYVTIGAAGSKAAFQSEVSSLVTKANVLSIGLDPAHRFTYVRGSKDLGLPTGPEVASAGNAFFKKADLVGGIDAIAGRATELRVATRTTETAIGVPIVVREEPMASGWWWGLGGLGAVVLGVCVWLWVGKRRREREHRRAVLALEVETAEKQIARLEGSDDEKWKALEATAATTPVPAPATRSRRQIGRSVRWEDPPQAPYYAPPAPVVVNQGNDLLTGMIIGDMLSHSHHHETVTRTVVERSDDSGSSSSSGWGSSDSGSSSSWSDSSSSSSSSSWDSGGGSDFGGGGGGDSW